MITIPCIYYGRGVSALNRGDTILFDVVDVHSRSLESVTESLPERSARVYAIGHVCRAYMFGCLYVCSEP